MTTYTCQTCRRLFHKEDDYEDHLKQKCKPIQNLDKVWEKLKQKKISDTKLKFIDLFSGIGSFHYSFSKKGWQCIMASDIDETTHEVYEKNYNIKPVGDIYKVDEKLVPNYDILCAGFPCQAFSQAGKHQGLDDKRGVLFLEIIRFAKYHKPKILALENVSALLVRCCNSLVISSIDWVSFPISSSLTKTLLISIV